MKNSKIELLIFIIESNIIYYILVAFLNWDLFFIFKIGEWDALERLYFLVGYIISIVIGLIAYLDYKENENGDKN